MASGLNNPSSPFPQFTFHGEEIKSLAQLIRASKIYSPDFSLWADVHQEVVTDTKVGGAGRMENVLKAHQGCNPTYLTHHVPMWEDTWQMISLEATHKDCAKDLDGQFYDYLRKKGIDRDNYEGTEILSFLSDLLGDAIKRDLYRKAWFDDTAAALWTSGGGGTLTPTAAVTDFNTNDGFWKKLYAIVSGTPARGTRIAATATGVTNINDGATYVAQTFTQGDVAAKVVSNALQAAHFESSDEMRYLPNSEKLYIVSQSVGDQYYKELLNANFQPQLEYLVNGITVIKSLGIDVMVHSEQDRIVRSYFNSGTKWYRPHRGVLVSKSALKLGLDTSDLENLDFHFDRKTRENYFYSTFRYDMLVPQEDFVQVIY